MSSTSELKILSGRANPDLAHKICEFLHLPLGRVALADFPDGEISCKIDDDVRGRDVFLVQPTCPPVNNNLMELLIMIDSCKRASAGRITAVLPYFGYARQDRKDEGRVPITAKLNVEKTLDLCRVKVHGEGSVRTGPSNDIRDQLGRNRHTALVLTVLPGITKVR